MPTVPYMDPSVGDLLQEALETSRRAIANDERLTPRGPVSDRLGDILTDADVEPSARKATGDYAVRQPISTQVVEPAPEAMATGDYAVRQPISSAATAEGILQELGRYTLEDRVKARDLCRENPGWDYVDSLHYLTASKDISSAIDPEVLSSLSPQLLETLLDSKIAGLARDDLAGINKIATAFNSYSLIYDNKTNSVKIEPSSEPSDDLSVPAGNWAAMKDAYIKAYSTAAQYGVVDWGAITRLQNTVDRGWTGLTNGLRNVLVAGMDLVAESYRREHTPGLQEGAQDPLQKDREGKAAYWQRWADEIRSINRWNESTTVTLPELPGLQGFINDLLMQGPQFALQIGAGVATGGLALPALLMGAQAFGETYGDLVTPSDSSTPVDVTTAALAAAANAVPQALLERISLEKFFAIFKASGVGNIARAAFGSASTEFMTELLQNYPDEISRMLARSYQRGKTPEEAAKEVGDALGAITGRGVYAGLQGAVMGLLGGAARGASENSRLKHGLQGARGAYKDLLKKKRTSTSATTSADAANPTAATTAAGSAPTSAEPTGSEQSDLVDEMTATDAGELSAEALIDLTKRMDEVVQATQFKDSLTDIAQTLDTTHVKAVSVDGAKEVASQAIPEGQRTTWLDAEDIQTALAQGEAPHDADGQTGTSSETLQALGITPERLNEAQATGEALPVDTAALCSLPSSPLREDLINRARRSPTSLSAKEAALVDPSEDLTGMFAALQAGTKSTQAMRAEVNRIRSELTAVSGPVAARQYTALLTAQARTMEARYGVDAAEMLAHLHVTTAETGARLASDGGSTGDRGTVMGAGRGAPAAQLFQSATPLDATAAATLKKEVKKYHQRIDHVFLQKKRHGQEWRPQSNVLMLRQIPLVANLLGATAPLFLEATKKGVWLGRHVFDEKHRDKITPDILKKLPEALVDPIAVFISKPQGRGERHDKRIVFMLEITDKNGATVVFPAEILAKSPGEAAELDIISVYSKNKNSSQASDKWFINELASNRVLYTNEKKMKEWMRTRGLQLPPELPSPTPSGRASPIESNILSQADLVKARKENPGLYQQDQQAAGAPRAQVFFGQGPDHTHTVIEVFKRGDLSSIPHELAHVFLQGMLTVVNTDQSYSTAREALARDVRDAGLDAAVFQPWVDGPLDLDTVRQQLEGWQKDLETAKKEARKRKISDDEKSQARATAARLSRQIAATESFLSRVENLEQARADIATLRKYAGVAETADLTPGAPEYIQLHEAVARGFEQYLYEGKAPTPELRGAFQRMKEWLLRIYRDIKKYVGLEVTDEVRHVFDRMLATEDELRRAQSGGAVFGIEASLDSLTQLTEVERSALKKALAAVKARASSKRDKRLLKDREERLATLEAQAKKEVASRPVWKLLAAVAADKTKSKGFRREDLVALLGEEKTAALAAAAPELFTEHGAPPQVIADALWSGDVDAMSADIYSTLVERGETFEGVAKALAEERAAAVDERIAPAESAALGLAEYDDFLSGLETALIKNSSDRRQARRIMNKAFPRAYYRHRAREILRTERVKDIRPGRYRRALQRQLDGLSAGGKGTRVEAQVKKIQAARLLYALASEAAKIQEEAAAIQKRAVRLAKKKPGQLPEVCVEGLRKLHTAYSLARGRTAADPAVRAKTLDAIITELTSEDSDADDVKPIFPDWLTTLANPATGELTEVAGPISWRELTIDQLRDVNDLQLMLEHLGRQLVAGNKESLAAQVNAVAVALVEAMSSLRPQDYPSSDAFMGETRRKIKSALQTFYSNFDSLQWECDKADGFKNTLGPDAQEGPARKHLFNPIVAGQVRADEVFEAVATALAPHFAALQETVERVEKVHGERLTLTGRDGRPVELPTVLQQAYGTKAGTMAQVVALALNVGNSGNRQRITAGFPDLTREAVAQLLGDDVASMLFPEAPAPATHVDGLLSAEDWRHLSAIGAELQKLWPRTQEVYRRKYGFTPRGVDLGVMQLTVGGEAVTLPEWYYPIRYDPAASERVARFSEQEAIASRSANICQIPAAKRGFTQGRAASTGLPLLLDPAVLPSHLVDVIRFNELALPVTFADKVFRDPRVEAAYKRVHGVADYRAIRPNLKGIVRSDPLPTGVIARLAEKVRPFLTFWALGWNLGVAGLQSTVLFTGAHDIGSGNMLRGMAALARAPRRVLAEVYDASPYMRGRVGKFDEDLKQSLTQLDVKRRRRTLFSVAGRAVTMDTVEHAGLVPISIVDQVCAGAIWLACYGKKLRELQAAMPAGTVADPSPEHHAQAVAAADAAVRQTNPDNHASSRGAFLRDHSAFERLFNMFASATTQLAQRSAYMYSGRARGAISAGRVVRLELYEYLLPAVAIALSRVMLRGALPGEGGGADEAKNSLRGAFLLALFEQSSIKVPIFGAMVADVAGQWLGLSTGGRRGDLSTPLTTPIRLLWRVSSAGSKVVHGEDDAAEKLAYATADLASFIAKVPVSRVVKRAQGASGGGGGVAPEALYSPLPAASSRGLGAP